MRGYTRLSPTTILQDGGIAAMDTFPDLGSLTDEELKDLIKQLTDEEMEISYRRRILHGKIDILRAELVNRRRRAIARSRHRDLPGGGDRGDRRGGAGRRGGPRSRARDPLRWGAGRRELRARARPPHRWPAAGQRHLPR